jgi:hypothetical protein
LKGRSSDLLFLLKPSRAPENCAQWLSSEDLKTVVFKELTAAGTVRDFHAIPFSFLPITTGRKPFRSQTYRIIFDE